MTVEALCATIGQLMLFLRQLIWYNANMAANAMKHKRKKGEKDGQNVAINLRAIY
ncbi:MAG: hypothetical protein IJN44_02800 [Clostridia bacterium]|nr:hypothetical protein [Clostridia bacterium]